MRASSDRHLAFPGGQRLTDAEVDDVYSNGVDTGGIDFSGADLSSDQPYQIADLLISNKLVSIVHIDLSFAKITPEGMDALFVAAMELKSLESLVCRGINLTAQAGLSLSRLLCTKGCMRILDVAENSLGDMGVSNLAGAFSTDHTKALQKQCISVMTLTVLDLSNNGITDAGVVALCRGMSQLLRRAANIGLSLALKVLRLSHNNIGDKAALCLAQLLNTPSVPTDASMARNAVSGSTLELDELWLDGNPITVRGIMALLPRAEDGLCSPLQRLSLAGTAITPDVYTHLAAVVLGAAVQGRGTPVHRRYRLPVHIDVGVSVEAALHLILGNYERAHTGNDFVDEADADPVAVLCASLKRLATSIAEQSIPGLEISLGALHSTLFNYAAHLQATRDVHNAAANDAQVAHIVAALTACNDPTAAQALHVAVVPNVTQWVRSAEYLCNPHSAVYRSAAGVNDDAWEAQSSDGYPALDTQATTQPDEEIPSTRSASPVPPLVASVPSAFSNHPTYDAEPAPAPVSMPFAAPEPTPAPAALSQQQPVAGAPAPARAPVATPITAPVPDPAPQPMQFRSSFLSTFKSTLGEQGSADLARILGGPSTMEAAETIQPMQATGSLFMAEAPREGVQQQQQQQQQQQSVAEASATARVGRESPAASILPVETGAARLPAESVVPEGVATASVPTRTGLLASALSSAQSELRTLSVTTGGDSFPTNPVTAHSPVPVIAAPALGGRPPMTGDRPESTQVPMTPLTAEEKKFFEFRTEHTAAMHGLSAEIDRVAHLHAGKLMHTALTASFQPPTAAAGPSQHASVIHQNSPVAAANLTVPPVTAAPPMPMPVPVVAPAQDVSRQSAGEPNFLQALGYLQAQVATMAEKQQLYEATFVSKFSTLEYRIEALEATLRQTTDSLLSVQRLLTAQPLPVALPSPVTQADEAPHESETSAPSAGSTSAMSVSEMGLPTPALAPAQAPPHTATQGPAASPSPLSSPFAAALAAVTAAAAAKATTRHTPTSTQSPLALRQPHSAEGNELLITDLMARLEVVENRVLQDRATALQAALNRQQQQQDRQQQRQDMLDILVERSVASPGTQLQASPYASPMGYAPGYPSPQPLQLPPQYLVYTGAAPYIPPPPPPTAAQSHGSPLHIYTRYEDGVGSPLPPSVDYGYTPVKQFVPAPSPYVPEDPVIHKHPHELARDTLRSDDGGGPRDGGNRDHRNSGRHMQAVDQAGSQDYRDRRNGADDAGQVSPMSALRSRLATSASRMDSYPGTSEQAQSPATTASAVRFEVAPQSSQRAAKASTSQAQSLPESGTRSDRPYADARTVARSTGATVQTSADSDQFAQSLYAAKRAASERGTPGSAASQAPKDGPPARELYSSRERPGTELNNGHSKPETSETIGVQSRYVYADYTRNDSNSAPLPKRTTGAVVRGEETSSLSTRGSVDSDTSLRRVAFRNADPRQSYEFEQGSTDSSLNYSVINNISRNSVSIAEDTLNSTRDSIALAERYGRSEHHRYLLPPSPAAAERPPRFTHTGIGGSANGTHNTVHQHEAPTRSKSPASTRVHGHSSTTGGGSGGGKTPSFMMPTVSNSHKASHGKTSYAQGHLGSTH